MSDETTTAPSPRDKFQAIHAALRKTYVERDDAIECILLGAVAQQHVLFLGPPGTGKSHLVTSLTRCITGCETFVTLMTKFTTEDELCGPAKLSALKLDRFERATAGHLPAAHVAFLDEVFKANAACLNATLDIANERTYKGAPVPLRMLAGASNEMPEDESLGAIYDRFLLRHVVEYVRDKGARKRLLSSEPRFQPPVSLTLTEWDQATAEARKLTVPEPVIDELLKIHEVLAGKSIRPSDRRLVQLLGVLRAAAWLDGCAEPGASGEVELDHLFALRHGLWQKQGEIAHVTATLNALPASPVRQAMAIVDEALRVVAQAPTEPDQYYATIPKLIMAIDDAAKRVRQVRVGKRHTARVNEGLGELKAARDKVSADQRRRLETPVTW